MEFTDSVGDILLWLHHQLSFAGTDMVAKCCRLCWADVFLARVQVKVVVVVVEMAQYMPSVKCEGFTNAGTDARNKH